MNASQLQRNADAGGRVANTAAVSPKATLEAPVDIADHVTLYGNTSVGSFTYINVGTVIYAKVQVGRFCSIGRSVEIGLAHHPVDFLSTHPFQVSESLRDTGPSSAGRGSFTRRLASETMSGSAQRPQLQAV